MKESTIGDYCEDKRKEAERLRAEILDTEQLMADAQSHLSQAILHRRLRILREKLELALYVGD